MTIRQRLEMRDALSRRCKRMGHAYEGGIVSILRKFASIPFFLCVSILSSSLSANENDWGLEISLSKQSYILHERIWLDVILTNISSDTLRSDGLWVPNHGGFGIAITDANGDVLEYTGPQSLLPGGPGQLLFEVGEQEFGSFDLLESFGNRDDSSGYRVLSWVFPYIPTGTYTVKVYCEGTVSDELAFDIVEPSGEERVVLGLIEEASSVYTRDNRGPSVQRFGSIVDGYPNSVFAEQCFYFSRRYTQKSRDEVRQGTFDQRGFTSEMLMNYPNSGHSRNWLKATTREMEDEEKLDLFNRLIEHKSGTRAARFARQMRDRILSKQKREEGER